MQTGGMLSYCHILTPVLTAIHVLCVCAGYRVHPCPVAACRLFLYQETSLQSC